MRRSRLLFSLALAVVLVASLVQVSAAAPVAKAIDRYTPVGVFPNPQHYLSGYGIARAADGTYWITDSARDRLVHTDASGTVLAYVGGSGWGNGRFHDPVGICIKYDGTIYVVDSGNARIQVFSAEGTYLRKFGQSGSGDGELAQPYGVAVDGQGYVWVSERGTHRIQKLSPTGAFVAKIGGPLSGSGDSQFSTPGSIVARGTGIFVADTYNSRVQVFDKDTYALRSKFGSYGSGDSQFSYPEGIALDDAGNVYVADTNNNRVTKWQWAATQYEYASKFGSVGTPDQIWTGGGYMSNPRALVASSDGVRPFVVVDSLGLRVWDGAGAAQIDQYLFGGYEAGGLNGPAGIAVATDTVWVGDSFGQALVRMTLSGTTFTYRSRITTYLPSPDPQAELGGVVDVACDSAGNVYALDNGYNRVVKFAADGSFLRRWGSTGAGDDQFAYPQGIYVHGNRVYVADTDNKCVKIFDLEGAFVAKFGTLGTLPDQFQRPTDVAVNGNGIYVCDYTAYAVKRFDTTTYAFIDAIGDRYGLGELGSFTSPTSVSLDERGDLYVLDQYNDLITKLDKNGVYLNRFGSLGTAADEFANPRSVAIAPAGRLLVADYGNNRISMFAPLNRTSTACSADVTAPSYNGTSTVTAWLKDADGAAIAGMQLDIQRSYNGSTWSHLAYVTSAATGTPIAVAGVTQKVWYRAVFTAVPASMYYASATPMAPAVIAPKVKSLTTPVAPSSAQRYHSFTAYGYLEPKHTAGGHSVRIYKYLKSGSTWVSKGFVTAHNYTAGSKTKYSVSMTLPTKGTWRLRAYAPADSLHAATWSTGSDTMTIR